MANNKYAYNEKDDGAKTARAMAKSLKISPKHSVEICNAIRGMDVEKAKAYLNDVIEIKHVDDLFAYRYFIAMNNPVVQEISLKEYPQHYRGC